MYFCLTNFVFLAMEYLKCNHCAYFNKIESEYTTFCSSCGKKLDNNYPNWVKTNPGKTFEDYKNTILVSKERIEETTSRKDKSINSKRNKYLILMSVLIPILSSIGYFAVNKLSGFSSTTKEDKFLTEMVNEANKSFPMMIDSETRIDNYLALPNNTLQYNYTLVNSTKDSLDLEELKNYLEPNIINNIKTNPDMQLLRDKNMSFNYYYKDKNGNYLFNIKVNPENYK